MMKNQNERKRLTAVFPRFFKDNFIIGLFLFSALLVIMVSLVANAVMNRSLKMLKEAAQNHLNAAVLSAAGYVSFEELDKYHTEEDTKTAEYEDLKNRLIEFGEKYRVLYVYYWRDYGDGTLQYIVDNDRDPETECTPDDFFEVEEVALIALSGKVGTTDLGQYTPTWDGLLTAFAPIYDHQGQIYCVAGVDISDGVILAQRRDMFILNIAQICALAAAVVIGGISILLYRKKARQSESANIAKSQFLSTMSHEIRTPMNAIIGLSELTLREEASPKVKAYVAEIKQSGSNLLSIINDILDFSKIESGRLDIIPIKYGLASLLNDTINIISVRLAEKSIHFEVNVDSSLPITLLGDEIRIRQILLNLLTNAVKYTTKGTITFSVETKALVDDTITIQFEVKDTGIGIKEADMKKLFGDFTRLDSEKNREVEGTGLGLAITNKLCRLMGGTITVASTYGKGSVFTITLPQQIIDPKPITTFTIGGDQRQVHTEFTVPFTAPEARILIVDDIPTNLIVAEGLLAPYNMQIDQALSGTEAIRLVKENTYDLIFMDHLMPGMDGIETVTIIRTWEKQQRQRREELQSKEKRREAPQGIPIIALTANAVAGMKELFLSHGFNDYISKPIELVKMNGVIVRWIPKEKKMKNDKTRKRG
jgi:signal transduction histidine kinase/CheY-like chemotaxis protein